MQKINYLNLISETKKQVVKNKFRKIIFFLITLFLLLLAFQTSFWAIDIAPKDQQQSKNRGLTLSDEEIRWVLTRTDELLKMPNTEILVSGAVDHLALQGNRMIPFLKDFLKHGKPRHREFGIVLLRKIATEESLSLLCEQFWEYYSKKDNVEKISASGAADAYHRIQRNSKISGQDEYWEARYIFRKILTTNSKSLEETCRKLVGDNNGVAVMATKYMWKINGKSYENKFYRFADSDENGEAFFTFLDELLKIIEEHDEKSYPDIETLKAEFNSRAIVLISKVNINTEIFFRLIKYLSKAEADWFAEHWISIYKEHKDKPNSFSWMFKKSGIEIGVSNNEKAQKKIGELKKFVTDKEYQAFKDSVEKTIKEKSTQNFRGIKKDEK